MPIWFFPALLGVLAVMSLSAGIWLLLHLPDVAETFAGRKEGEIVRGPAKRRASRATVWFVIIMFNAGWIACVLIWIFVMSGDANAVVRSEA